MDEAYRFAGGFGKFQWYYAIVLIIVFSLHGYVPYSLSYLLLMPPFLCKPADDPNAEFQSCEHTDFFNGATCDPAIAFIPDMDTARSLFNWAFEMELYCTSKLYIGLFGSLYFVGFMVGSMTLLRLADIYGRRPLLLLGIAIHVVAVFFIIWLSSLIARYCFITLLGIATGITVNCTFVLLVELVPAR